MSNQQNTTVHQNSAGTAISSAAGLDGHYVIAKAQYEACIADVGIQPGWRVLDAGCGNGVFLPHIAALVGATGHVAAIDHAPEAINLVREWVTRAAPAASVDARVGSIAQLPFDDTYFDCVWCANTLQYLDNDALARVLDEFKRVLKPGGLIAIKDIDSRMLNFSMIHP
jgi:ubiquinone/menaquinone biosynthesis C-methylase UbiE